jgi:hypothetical protein
MSEIESIIDDLLNEEQNIYGIGIISRAGELITQTANWDLTNDLALINEMLNQKVELGQKGISSLIILGIKYMIVENAEERKIGTNIAGKGHIIICPIPIGGTGAIIAYINPQVGPRDALFNVQEYAKKLENLV